MGGHGSFGLVSLAIVGLLTILAFLQLQRHLRRSGMSFTTRIPTFPSAWPYTADDLRRDDPSPDPHFYSSPRFVTHIDDRCIAALTNYYGSVLPQPSVKGESPARNPPRILDLCSSWISHLPTTFQPPDANVVGIGMNAAELAQNPVLSEHHVCDLNAAPLLPPDMAGDFDAVVCSVSVDYLVQPREIMSELARVMKRGAWAHMSFSNRCFPTKVVGRWLRVSEDERCDQVANYFHFAGTTDTPPKAPGELFDQIEIVRVLQPSWSGDPLYVVRGKKR